MSSSERHEQLLPFPRLPEAVKQRYSISELTLRPFGIYENDLNLDFINSPRPFLVTDILDSCTTDVFGNRVDRNLFWDLTVGARTECLLRLISAGDQFEIELSLKCPNRDCGHELELGLNPDEISELQQQAQIQDYLSLVVKGQQLKLRRPTGNDQLLWLKSSFESEDAALQQMFRTLTLAGAETLAADSLDEVGRVMEEHDPLVRFSVQVRCPDCEHEGACEVDLEELSLNRLRQAQFRLLAAVHRLAAHYHWSEEEIFKVPYWRRDYYLGLLDREKQR